MLTCGIIVSMLNSSAIDHGFEPRSEVKPKTIKVYIASLLSMQQWSKNKTGRLRIRMCTEWSDMSTHVLLFQWASTIKIQRVGLEQSCYHHRHLIKMLTFFHHDIAEKNWSFGIKKQSLITQYLLPILCMIAHWMAIYEIWVLCQSEIYGGYNQMAML